MIVCPPAKGNRETHSMVHVCTGSRAVSQGIGNPRALCVDLGLKFIFPRKSLSKKSTENLLPAEVNVKPLLY